MIEESIEIQLYDNEFENLIISIEGIDNFGFARYIVKWEDTVNGYCGKESMYLGILVDKIYKNRAFVNKSEQLKNI